MRKLILGLFIATTLSGCATIFSGSRQKFIINSNVEGANVSIVNKINGVEVHKGSLPDTVKLRRSSGYFQKAEYTVNVSADGYQENHTTILFGLNGWYFGNILIGGVVGMVGVDPGTGAMWKSKQKEIKVELEKK
jgi:hypothetical protein